MPIPTIKATLPTGNAPVEGAVVVSPPGAKRAPDSLTRRAALANLNGLIEQATRIITGLIVTPIVIRALGVELYGAWSMIGQIQSNLATSDFRASGTLKVLLMLDQHVDDNPRKRRLVGAALIVWMISLALLLAVGLVVVPLAPQIIKTSPAHSGAVRVALALTLVALGISQLGSIPSNMLRGSNLDYKSMGLRSVVNLVVAFAGMFAVLVGFGLPGLASANVASTLLIGLLWFHLSCRHIIWFGATKPLPGEMSAFFKNSLWFVLVNQGQALLLVSDIIIVGYLFGPAAAGAYSATGMLIRFGLIPVTNLIASTAPGLVGLCGKGDWDRVGGVLRQITVLFLVGGCSVGAVALALNEAVLGRLLGIGFLTDQPLGLLLVLLQLMQCLYRIEATVIDGARAFKQRALITLVCGVTGLALTWGLAGSFGAHGVALGMIVACLLATLGLARVIEQRTGLSLYHRYGGTGRTFLMGGLLLGACYLIRPPVGGWPVLIASAVILGAAALTLMVFVGVDSVQRDYVWKKIREALGKGKVAPKAKESAA